mmetsp:Transcript_60366/g.184400  ORF Transcript_60366/g.184400 Transcript_60366/m.184400 type:complete len:200 (+) Transcript_60366:185-784(+)
MLNPSRGRLASTGVHGVVANAVIATQASDATSIAAMAAAVQSFHADFGCASPPEPLAHDARVRAGAKGASATRGRIRFASTSHVAPASYIASVILTGASCHEQSCARGSFGASYSGASWGPAARCLLATAAWTAAYGPCSNPWAHTLVFGNPIPTVPRCFAASAWCWRFAAGANCADTPECRSRVTAHTGANPWPSCGV